MSTLQSLSAHSSKSYFRVILSVVELIYGIILLIAAIYIGVDSLHKQFDSMALVVALPALLLLAGSGAGLMSHPNWIYPTMLGNLLIFAIVCSMIPLGLTMGGGRALLAFIVPAVLSIFSGIEIIRQRRAAAGA